jgi:predicted dinucleotide-binding enzyme
MVVGFLGAGHLSRRLGASLLAAGHEIVLTNSRGPHTLVDLVAELGSGASATSDSELVDSCDLIILAVRWEHIDKAFAQLGACKGKIVVDPINNLGSSLTDRIEIGERTSSEIIAGMLADARIVKAFNHAPINRMAKPKGLTLYLCGNDADAKDVVAGLIRDIGGVPYDTGDLRDGERLQGIEGPLFGHDRLLSVEETETLAAASQPGSGR